MLVNIRIECDDEAEVLTHLSVIRSQFRKAFKKNDKLLMSNKKQKAIIEAYDNNCYGVHRALAHIFK